VLLSACRVFLGTEKPAQLEATLAQGRDWDKVLQLANRQGVMPLLYRTINQSCPQAVPQKWLARLKMLYLQNTAQNLKMTSELLKILDAMREASIKAVPLKGPILAQQAYGDISARTFVDLDILVPKKDVMHTKDLLLLEGYCPDLLLNQDQEKAYLKSQCEYNFNQKARGIHLEVHWQLLPSCYAIGFDENGIWSRINAIAFNDCSIPVLSSEDLLLALCIHSAKHWWGANTLKMICDVGAVLHSCPNLDWNQTMRCAGELHVERLLLLGCKLAEGLLGIELPEDISKKSGDDKAIRSMVSNILSNLMEGSKRSSMLMEGFSFWSLARERHSDRIRSVMGLALQPMGEDLQKVPLPAWLYPLYHIIHPVRIICDYGMKGREI